VLLQIAHPAIGHAIAEHSNFSERPLDRLRSTMSYVYAVVYGTSGQVVAVRRAVNRAHARVLRQPDAASRGCNAFDAETQLWVVATLYDTMVTVHEKIHGPLDDASADVVYREYAKIDTALQLPEKMWRPSANTGTAPWPDWKPTRSRCASHGTCFIPQPETGRDAPGHADGAPAHGRAPAAPASEGLPAAVEPAAPSVFRTHDKSFGQGLSAASATAQALAEELLPWPARSSVGAHIGQKAARRSKS
jgi:hypothetical protein